MNKKHWANPYIQEDRKRNKMIKESCEKAQLEHICQRCKHSTKNSIPFVIGLNCQDSEMFDLPDNIEDYYIVNDDAIVQICPDCYNELLNWFNIPDLDRTGTYSELTRTR